MHECFAFYTSSPATQELLLEEKPEYLQFMPKSRSDRAEIAQDDAHGYAAVYSLVLGSVHKNESVNYHISGIISSSFLHFLRYIVPKIHFSGMKKSPIRVEKALLGV